MDIDGYNTYNTTNTSINGELQVCKKKKWHFQGIPLDTHFLQLIQYHTWNHEQQEILISTDRITNDAHLRYRRRIDIGTTGRYSTSR